MIILPAIDLIGGRCVRLSQGDYNQQTQYEATPADMVKQYVAHGLKRIHVVDLDGAKAAHPQNLDTLRQLATQPGAEIEWGGGIKSTEALQQVFEAGAKYAVVGSVAAKHPELFEQWLQQFGPERMVLGADVRQGRVAINGLTQVICTDISRDGMLQGPATELYVRLQQKYPMVDFTISGGISSVADIQALKAAQLRRVIVGKAIYEGRITLDELC